MATARAHRIGIWIIAIVMAAGTVLGSIVLILSSQNDQSDLAKQQKILDDYRKQLQDQSDKLSAQYYEGFKQYESSPAAFDAESVGDTVTTTDLEVGTGAEVTADTSYQAYYIGWNPKGKVFDSSFDGTKLKSPIDGGPSAGLIEGWTTGVIGMKVGGVRELTIPSDLAYKDADKGADIPPNTPLKFIVKIISAA